MATPPPPKRRRCSLEDLANELISEILIRIPAYKVSLLIRCTAVCKFWRGILTDPDFLGRYREFQRVPPILGFIFHLEVFRHRLGSRFSRTTAFRPSTLDHDDLSVIDSRHGRVILHEHESFRVEIFVWDPVTEETWSVPHPAVPFYYWVATVLCAAAAPGSGRECDHLDCHGGHFLVAVVGSTEEGVTCACVYSSEVATWGEATYGVEVADGDDATFVFDDMDMRPSALVGNTINFITPQTKTIVEYDLGRRQLALIDPPFVPDDYAVIMPAAGGRALGFAAVRQTCLHLYTREAGPGGIKAWKQGRVIELNTLPTGGYLCSKRTPVGFAEGHDVIFVRTNAGVFAIALRSGRVKKVSPRATIDIFVPYMSFYTPDRASG